MNPLTLYAPPPAKSPKMERLLAQSLSPIHNSRGSKSELVSLRSKLWDAQKLTRVILGKESIELKNKDILKAIREVAEMKQELKALRKKSRKFDRFKARLAKQQHKAAIVSAPAAYKQDMMMIDEEEQKQGESSSASDSYNFYSAPTVCSCCRKVLDDDEDDDDIDDEQQSHHRGGGGESSLKNQPDPSPPSSGRKLSTAVARSGKEGLLGEHQAKIKAWQERLRASDQAHQEAQIQECKTDVQEMYIALAAFEQSKSSQHNIIDSTADVRTQLDHLVKTISSIPTMSEIKELKQSIEVHQHEQGKLKRALDTALEENRNLRDENNCSPHHFATTMNTTSVVPQRVSLSASRTEVSTTSKKTLASRFLKKIRRVYRKDTTTRTTKGSANTSQKLKAVEEPKTLEHPQHEVEIRMATTVETEEEGNDCYYGFDDDDDGHDSSVVDDDEESADGLPPSWDLGSEGSSEIIFENCEDADEDDTTTEQLSTTMYYDVNEDQVIDPVVHWSTPLSLNKDEPDEKFYSIDFQRY